MPSLKQRLRQLELQREEDRRRQLAHLDLHRLFDLARQGKGEAEIAQELGVAPELARQVLGQMPRRPSRN